MHDMAKIGRRSVVLLAAAVAALAAAPVAQAGLHVSMGATGLSVTTDQTNATEVLQVTGVPSPEGSIGTWNVDPLCVSNIFDPSGAGCSDTNDADCNVLAGSRRVIRCARTAPGVHIVTQGARDRIHVGTSGTDPVTIDAGDGDDEVGADSLFDDVAVGPSSGPWTALLGPGNDTYVGSQGGDFVSGDTGNDTIDPGAGSDGVSAGPGSDRVFAGPESESGVSDAYDGGAGFDTLDYSARTTGIFAALVGTTGGAPGESDGIAGFERILGGAGNDSILGFSSNGGGGNDTLTGRQRPGHHRRRSRRRHHPRLRRRRRPGRQRRRRGHPHQLQHRQRHGAARPQGPQPRRRQGLRADRPPGRRRGARDRGLARIVAAVRRCGGRAGHLPAGRRAHLRRAPDRRAGRTRRDGAGARELLGAQGIEQDRARRADGP